MDKITATPMLDTAVLRALNASQTDDLALAQDAVDAELNQMLESALADHQAPALDEGESILTADVWQSGSSVRLSSLSAPQLEPNLQQLVEQHSDKVSDTLKQAA